MSQPSRLPLHHRPAALRLHAAVGHAAARTRAFTPASAARWAASVSGLLDQVGAGSEFGTVVTTDQRRRLLRGLFASYYAEQPAGRHLRHQPPLGRQAAPPCWTCSRRPRSIACVRNVAWVMDSIERLYRANPYENTRLFNDGTERNTVYSRVRHPGTSATAWWALPGRRSREAFYGEQAKVAARHRLRPAGQRAPQAGAAAGHTSSSASPGSTATTSAA